MLRRRPKMFRINNRPAHQRLFARRVAIKVVAIHAQTAQRHHALRVRLRQPVHHIDIVGALLQQQTFGIFALGVPILEVIIAAVPDEMATPNRFNRPIFPSKISSRILSTNGM